jgi:hypothetical protein
MICFKASDAHLDNDPLRRASNAIASKIAATLNGNKEGLVYRSSDAKAGRQIPAWLLNSTHPVVLRNIAKSINNT